MALQFQFCSLHQATSLQSHKVPFPFHTSQVQPFHFTKHHHIPRAQVPFPSPSSSPSSPETRRSPFWWAGYTLRLWPSSLRRRQSALEPHQYCNPGTKARRQQKAISISQLRQNNRAKCFLEVIDPELWTACRVVLGPQEEDTLCRTCGYFG